MTVQELIERLKTVPPDWTVVARVDSTIADVERVKLGRIYGDGPYVILQSADE